MAGPVPTYLATQLAAQGAFNVPFGLLALVNGAITTATSAGEFNVTVDCSLFNTEDVSNLRVYLDSLGYGVEFAKDSNQKSLNIDWGRFLDIPGSEVVVDQGTSPWIVAGTVSTMPVTSSTATVTVVTVTNASTLLLAANPSRKAFTVQCKTSAIYLTLGSTSSTSIYSSYLLKLNEYERNDYTGPVSAILAAGTADVVVTELT